VGAASICGTAHAVLLSHDPFLIGTDPSAGEYTIGGLNGQNPTIPFFGGAWVGTTGTGFGTLLNTQAISATKPGLVHASTGGSVAPGDANFDSGFGNGPGPFTGSVSTRAMRPMATGWDLTTSGDFWIGMLIGYGKQNGVTGYRTWEMWNDATPLDGADDGARTLQVGYSGAFGDFNDPTDTDNMLPDTYDGNKLYARINNDATTSVQFASGTDIVDDNGAVHCLVAHFHLSTDRNSDQVDLYLDPMGLDESMIGAPDVSFSGIEFQANIIGAESQFMFETNSTLPDSTGIFDELRIGTTYADVACMRVPEPATVSLFGMGALAMLLAARRKRA
jgi:hypothetical protein